MSAPPSSSPHSSPSLGSVANPQTSPVELELAAALKQNAQMQAAGTALQQKLAAAEAEKASLAARVASAERSSSSGSSGAGRSQPKGPTPPEFHGKTGGYEIDSWVREMKVQFAFYGERVFPDDSSKVRHAAMFLKGRAAEWWEAEDKSTGVESSWDRFVERLRERYRPMQASVTARERLRRLKQTGSVSAYADVFQKELTPIKDMHPSDQIFNFVSGLSSVNVANKVREKEPKSLHEAMDIAVRAEVFLAAGRGGHLQGFGGRSGGSASSSSSSAQAGAAPMDLNAVSQEEANDHTEESSVEEKTSPTSLELSPALMAKVEAMVQHRVAAMFQSKNSNGNKNDSRVPGLKASDIEKLRAEGRCFRCKQKGHTKRDCPQGGKSYFQ
jgi:hypothetical protein